MMGLSSGEKFSTVTYAVLMHYRIATDVRTDGQTDIQTCYA